MELFINEVNCFSAKSVYVSLHPYIFSYTVNILPGEVATMIDPIDQKYT